MSAPDHDGPPGFDPGWNTPATRREFLRLGARGLGLIAFSQYVPGFLSQSVLAQTPPPGRDRTILVLVQLGGGNDGLNTVIQYQDANYYRLRPGLGIRETAAGFIRHNDTLGLHPALAGVKSLMDSGKLCLVQNVGYPNPNRSHFRSTEIWETASAADIVYRDGWMGRFLNANCSGMPANGDPGAMNSGTITPQSFHSDRNNRLFGFGSGTQSFQENTDRVRLLEGLTAASAPPAASAGDFLKQTYLDALVTERRVFSTLTAYRNTPGYPNTAFAASLRNVAGLIAAGFETRVYFVNLGGFDTHNAQGTVAGAHAGLLAQLSQGLAAFQADLDSKGLGAKVLTMTFSEFGRTAVENASGGTDHGTSAPLFLMGPAVRTSLFGTAPDLSRAARGIDPIFGVDFRSIYATILQRWLGCSPDPILYGAFPQLEIL